MLTDKHKQSHRWETQICFEIYNKVEQIVEDRHFFVGGLI